MGSTFPPNLRHRFLQGLTQALAGSCAPVTGVPVFSCRDRPCRLAVHILGERTALIWPLPSIQAAPGQGFLLGTQQGLTAPGSRDPGHQQGQGRGWDHLAPGFSSAALFLVLSGCHRSCHSPLNVRTAGGIGTGPLCPAGVLGGPAFTVPLPSGTALSSSNHTEHLTNNDVLLHNTEHAIG